jgi:hypothetical protein
VRDLDFTPGNDRSRCFEGAEKLVKKKKEGFLPLVEMTGEAFIQKLIEQGRIQLYVH